MAQFIFVVICISLICIYPWLLLIGFGIFIGVVFTGVFENNAKASSKKGTIKKVVKDGINNRSDKTQDETLQRDLPNLNELRQRFREQINSVQNSNY
ncbi:hypothetical protein N9174_03895 [bacterium]|nr:hypothetical protein [bacterium]